MKRVICVVVFCMMLLCQGVFAEGTNLVQNPGFEEVSSNAPNFWAQKAWIQDAGVSVYEVVSSGARSGKNCVKITSTKENDARYTQEIYVNPNTLYKISGWIKTENIPDAQKGANISIWMIMETSLDVKGTSDWKYVEMYGRTGSDQKSIPLTLSLGGHGALTTGTAYFDDIAIEEVKNVPQGSSIINLFSSPQGGDASSPDTANNTKNTLFIIAAVVAVIIIALFFVFLSLKKSSSQASPAGKTALSVPSSGSNDGPIILEKAEEQPKKKLSSKMEKIDYIIMSVMTIAYLILTPFNLGSMDTPQKYWQPTQLGENVIIKFDKPYSLTRVNYHYGFGKGKYRIEYLEKDGKYSPMLTIEMKDGDFFKWANSPLSVTTDQIRIIVDSLDPAGSGLGGALNEIAFFADGSQKPIKLSKDNIKEKKFSENDKGSPENLLDEQDRVAYAPNFMNGTYFDEIYHARTAFEHLNLMPFYENTHPPLGKLIIAVGIGIFGMNPFGWRIAGALFGAAMIPLMYLFGKKMFKKPFYAFISAFLMMFDFMHFTQTRIATIDTYGVIFVILMYYFMYDAFTKKSYNMSYAKSLIPLLMAGIFFGIGSASKWIGAYAGAGLAVLYFTAKILEYLDYEKAKVLLRRGKAALARKDGSSKRNIALYNSAVTRNWTHNFVWNHIIRTSLLCVIFFVIIPVILYVSSYIPIMMTPGNERGLEDVKNYQVHMYKYHSELKATHPFQSTASSWPLVEKPIWFYGGGGDVPQGKSSTIVSMGNPAIWWVGMLAVLASIFISIWKRDKKMIVIFVALAFQYLPWFGITRCIFIYHFFSSVPFMMLCIVYVIKFLIEDFPKVMQNMTLSKSAGETTALAVRYGVYVYLAIVALLFIWFYPALSGMTVDSDYIASLRWFKSWNF
ncbi:MAG: glycosyltransferase family 39 protein [Clostridia bacterium]|nr:glycosyltransferase family 39 protein [Clostridia bacterium]